MRMRHAATIAAALSITGGTLALVPSPAQAAAAGSCYASGCEGKNPATHCQSDARTVDSLELGSGTLELRYSPSCRAAWARMSANGWDRYDALPPMAKVVRNQDGKSYTCKFSSETQQSCHTSMVNDAGYTSYAYGEYDGGARVYTGRTGSY